MKTSIEGGLNHFCSASALQLHGDVIIFCDEDSTSTLESVTVALLKKELRD